MDKTTILRYLALVGKAGAVAAFAVNVLPPEKAALLFAATSALKEIAHIVGDYLDDGVKNDSFKE